MARHFSPYEEKLQINERGVEANRAVLGEILKALASDNFDGIEPHLADDVEMDVHGFPIMNGSWSGKAEVLAALRRNFSLVTEQRPHILEMVEAGDIIAVRFEEGGRLEESRALYAVRGIQWFRFSDGKLKYFEEYLQPVPVLPEGMP
jgi:ketosteroid isomerase-like protein